MAMHHRLGRDGDGFVTYDEMLRAAMTWVAPKGVAVDPVGADKAAVRARFAAADLDHDGRISLAEAITGSDAAFDAQDTNHDGVLDPQERSAALGRMVQQVGRDIDALAKAHQDRR